MSLEINSSNFDKVADTLILNNGDGNCNKKRHRHRQSKITQKTVKNNKTTQSDDDKDDDVAMESVDTNPDIIEALCIAISQSNSSEVVPIMHRIIHNGSDECVCRLLDVIFFILSSAKSEFNSCCIAAIQLIVNQRSKVGLPRIQNGAESLKNSPNDMVKFNAMAIDSIVKKHVANMDFNLAKLKQIDSVSEGVLLMQMKSWIERMRLQTIDKQDSLELILPWIIGIKEKILTKNVLEMIVLWFEFICCLDLNKTGVILPVILRSDAAYRSYLNQNVFKATIERMIITSLRDENEGSTQFGVVIGFFEEHDPRIISIGIKDVVSDCYGRWLKYMKWIISTETKEKVERFLNVLNK
eukprot:171718_1